MVASQDLRLRRRQAEPATLTLEALLPAAGAATALWLMAAALLFLV